MKEYIINEDQIEDEFTVTNGELIRCKDCKYYRKDRFVCDLTKYASTEDDFCSWAEGKKNEPAKRL